MEFVKQISKKEIDASVEEMEQFNDPEVLFSNLYNMAQWSSPIKLKEDKCAICLETFEKYSKTQNMQSFQFN